MSSTENIRSKDYIGIDQYKTFHASTKRTIKHNKAFEIMKLTFAMDHMAPAYLMDEQLSIKYEELKKQKELLIKELYKLLVTDGDI